MINPFRPTAGAEPPRIIGRDEVVAEFVVGLQSGVGAPSRLMRITGPRGSGKTVLLYDLRNKASELGWQTAVVSAGPSLLDNLAYELESSINPKSASVEVNLGLVSANLDFAKPKRNIRALMKAAASKGGLFIAIDEVQDADEDDMREIASAVQLLIGEKVDIALAFAGLPAGVMDLINGRALTFLRRAQAEELTRINQVEVAISLKDSFAATGLVLDGSQLETAARATEGYAFLIQLVGFYIWNRADEHRDSNTNVTDADVETGLALAFARFHDAVHEPCIANLSLSEVSYLLAMSEDKTVSKTSDLVERMGRKSNELSSIRSRLLQREVIQAPRRGYVEFAVPGLRDYLRKQREEILERY